MAAASTASSTLSMIMSAEGISNELRSSWAFPLNSVRNFYLSIPIPPSAAMNPYNQSIEETYNIEAEANAKT